MKKFISILAAAALVMSIFVMTGCTSEENLFGCSDISEKEMTVEAYNSGEDGAFLTGSLVVDEGEQLTIESDLEEGTVQLDFIVDEGEASADEVPDIDEVEPAVTVTVKESGTQTTSIKPGSYSIKGTSVESATGTITVKVTAE